MLRWLPIVLLAAPFAAQEEELTLIARPSTLGVASEGIDAPIELGLPGRSDYRIGRQDLLEVRVFEVDELDQIVQVI